MGQRRGERRGEETEVQIVGDSDKIGNRDLWASLRELEASAFPKRCRSCGRMYQNAEEFGATTLPLTPTRVGLVPSQDDDGRAILELHRNCECGSTLMEFFAERRDTSPAGEARRLRFGILLDELTERGIARDVARAELLKVVRGGRSELLEQLEAAERGKGG